ncbi:MAG: nucleoside-diphosphate kinase [Candidatus Neomarinimicrobiota bacterium]|nr:MAG: nucleoside-diphosphate kinase [Candidatus Neomarinimicrobiota bacterium]
MTDLTLAILKPDCVRRKLTGKVIDFIESKGFQIISMKKVKLDRAQAEAFYAIHKNKNFFNDLVLFMTSGPCIPMILQKNEAVTEFREIIGNTDPKNAKEGTLRRLYADNIQENAIHGSDSVENAKKEIAFFFPLIEIIS